MEKQYNLPVCGGQTYQNPLPFANQNQTNPDPFVMKHRGVYYCYSSDAGGVNVSCSRDLIHWEYRGYAMTEAGRQEYWAPCAYYYNGRFYLYYSTAPAGKFDCHQEQLRVAVSDNPLGGFVLEQVFFDTFSIDAHVIRDTDGTFYLFYSPNNYMGTDENAAGTVILVDRLLDLTTLEGAPKAVVLPTIEQEIYAKNRFGDGRDWHTIEGALYFTHFEKAYLLYSANAFVHENYFIGYSTADKNCLVGELCWHKHPHNDGYDPLVRRNGVVEGTGHNSVVKAPNNVDDWLIYHGRNCADELIEGTEQRHMRIDPLFFDADRLVTNAPSYEMQRAPYAPLFRDDFSRIDPDRWEILSGAFEAEEESMRCASTSGCCLARLNVPIQNYLLEVDIAAEPTHMGARFGVMLWCENALNYLEAQLDAGKNTVSLVLSLGGIANVLQTVSLERGFCASAYHNLLARRCFDRFEVAIDGVPRLFCTTPLPYGPVALSTRYSIARFSACSVTETFALHGESICMLSRLFDSDKPLRCEDSAVYNRSPHPAVLRAKHVPTGDFTQEITLALLRADAQVRCALCGKAEFSADRVGFTVRDEDGRCTNFALGAKEFTLRVVFEQGQLWIFVQGNVVTLPAPPKLARCMEIGLHGAAIKSFCRTRI